MLKVTIQPSTLKPCEELLPNPLLNSSHESMSKIYAELLQECLEQLLQVTTNASSVDTVEKGLQQSSL